MWRIWLILNMQYVWSLLETFNLDIKCSCCANGLVGAERYTGKRGNIIIFPLVFEHIDL